MVLRYCRWRFLPMESSCLRAWPLSDTLSSTIAITAPLSFAIATGWQKMGTMMKARGRFISWPRTAPPPLSIFVRYYWGDVTRQCISTSNWRYLPPHACIFNGNLFPPLNAFPMVLVLTKKSPCGHGRSCFVIEVWIFYNVDRCCWLKKKSPCVHVMTFVLRRNMQSGRQYFLEMQSCGRWPR